MTVNVISKLAIQGGADSPIIDASAAKNGFAVVANTTERGTILASVKAGNGFMVYRLDGGTAGTGAFERWNGSTWVEIPTGGGGAGGGRSYKYGYSATTTAGDPGPGLLRLSSGTYSAVTSIYIDNVDTNNTSVTAWLDAFDDYVGSVKGILRLQSVSDSTKVVDYAVTAVVDSTGYRTLTVVYLGGNGTLTTTAGDTNVSFDSIGISSNLNGQALTNANGIGYSEKDDGTSGSGTKNIDFSLGAVRKIQQTGNCTYTWTPPAAGTAVQFSITNEGTTGGWVPILPGNIVWDKGYGPVWGYGPNVKIVLSGWYDGTNFQLINPDRGVRQVMETTTARTLVATDANANIQCTNASGCSVTVPPRSSVPFEKGTVVTAMQMAAGQVTFVQGSGVTIITPETRKSQKQYATIGVELLDPSTDTWMAFGNLEVA